MSYFENDSKIEEWLQKRRSRFTASENWKLLRTQKQPHDQLWSAMANTYIETKVIELTTKIYQKPEIEEVEALLHGKENEYPAYERYIKETGNYSMTYMGDENPMFIPCEIMPNESGGTPDVGNITSDGKIDWGCELKNPVNPAFHFRRLTWKTMWDVKEGYPSCYCQIQDLIRLTGASGWDFVSHDVRQFYTSKQIVIIKIEPDRKYIDNLEMRIRLAVNDKYKLLSKHMGTEIKNRDEFINLIKNDNRNA